MSDVSALMDKLKSTISYKQFGAPRADNYSWPILEKMARVKSDIARGEIARGDVALSEVARVESAKAEISPLASQAPEVERPSAGSLFQRLQVEDRVLVGEAAPAPKGGLFGRYASAKGVDEAPQALSEIFERIGRKAR